MVRRKTKKKKTVSKIFSIILSIISVLFTIALIYLKVIPFKYLMPGIIIYIFIYLFIIKMLFAKIRIKRIIGIILSFLISLVIGVASFYIISTLGIIDNFGNVSYKTLNYEVVVLKSSAYKEINDLKDKKIGVLTEDDLKISNKAINTLKKTIAFKELEDSDVNNLVDNLLKKDNDALLIEESKYNILTEEDASFASKVKVIYTFSIDVKVKNINKKVNIIKSSFNVYISGIDTYGKITSVSRSDVNIVATINPKTHQILLTSIPRDYYVQLHGISGYKDKLTHAGIYGIEKSVQTVEDLLDIDINYYVKVNFTSLIKIVDALGGVSVYSNHNFTSIDGIHYTKGYNNLNGEKALSFVRERKAFNGGDRVRGENQQAMLEALFKKAMSPKIITSYTSIIKSLDKNFITNMEYEELTNLIKKEFAKGDDWQISFVNLDGSDASEYTHSYKKNRLYVMIPDEESVNSAKEKIKEILD